MDNKIDYIEIAVETNETGYWIGLCYPHSIKEAREVIKHQIEIIGRKKRNLRIVKRTHIIKEEIIQ